MKSAIATILLVLGPFSADAQHHGAGHMAHAQPSPYAGEAKREIKGLSAQEQQAWLEGQGQGLARPAELNGYPGPMHVLELGEQLGLRSDQVASSRELMARHKAEARTLGARLVDAERRLDLLFAEQRATTSEIERLTTEIGGLQAQIRASHLNTHLAQMALLSAQQVTAYRTLRGYSK